MASASWVGTGIGGDDGGLLPQLILYNIGNDVHPSSGSPDSTDVMLIQFLVAQFFAAQTYPQTSDFLQLHGTATKGGKRWDDGVYGANTREGVRLFEEAAFAPVKDGVFRTSPFNMHLFQPYESMSKLAKLNWVFDTVCSSDVAEKNRLIRLVANPKLAARIVVNEG